MEHNTPLSYHFKDKHIWFDMALLAALFVVAAYFPVLKIVPLVASLELFSFFSFHLLAKRSRFQLQGFLGGFISSTAVFLQMLNDAKFSSIGARDLMQTLLFAICAMLLESLFIIFFLAEGLSFIYYLPFITQLVFFGFAILYINRSASSRFAGEQIPTSGVDIGLLNDHPILWKNVIKFSALILIIIYGTNFISSELGLSRSLSTLLISLFEAHAVLASVMTEWSLRPQNIELMKLLFLILLGNFISKSFLVSKGGNLTQKWFLICVMLAGFLTSVGVTLLWSLLNPYN